MFSPLLMQEIEDNCRKNIRQHPERKDHWIEADPEEILAIIDDFREMQKEVAALRMAATGQYTYVDNDGDLVKDLAKNHAATGRTNSIYLRAANAVMFLRDRWLQWEKLHDFRTEQLKNEQIRKRIAGEQP